MIIPTQAVSLPQVWKGVLWSPKYAHPFPYVGNGHTSSTVCGVVQLQLGEPSLAAAHVQQSQRNHRVSC